MTKFQYPRWLADAMLSLCMLASVDIFFSVVELLCSAVWSKR